jgi:Protein of unknown function (DUF3618)
MADPDGVVEVQGKVAVHGAAAKPDPDQIVAEIEQTRDHLARTIDILTDKVSPANNVRRLKDRAAQEASRPEVQLAAAAAGLAVIGLMIYRIWGRKR